MSRPNLYEANYNRLLAVLRRQPSDLKRGRSYRYRAPGFMELVVERLPACPETRVPVLSLAHYFEQNGDLCADPDMTIRIFEPSAKRERGMVEALTFSMAIPPIHHAVYPAPGKVDPQLKRDLNEFLVTWLRNLKAQGHQPIFEEAS